MTAEEALTEVGKVTERLRELDEMLHRAVRNTTSEAIPLLQQQIEDAMARRAYLMQFVQDVLVDGEAAA
jgi:tartrate dehydratase alpha subunit/fumarate hydratase class I-like protein